MNTSEQDQRVRTKNEIKQLLNERNTVLSQYYSLTKQTKISSTELQSINEMIEEFCQVLIDYMATGHFEIYRRIEDGKERRKEMLKLAEKIMPRITYSTQIAVAFNDIYDSQSALNKSTIKKLSTHLSKLGEQLAIRIELEDQFIHNLVAHKKPLN